MNQCENCGWEAPMGANANVSDYCPVCSPEDLQEFEGSGWDEAETYSSLRHMTAKQIKDVLSHHIERPFLSVQKRGERIEIKVKGNPGLHQANTGRERLRAAGFSVTVHWYHKDDYLPSSVRITIPTLGEATKMKMVCPICDKELKALDSRHMRVHVREHVLFEYPIRRFEYIERLLEVIKQAGGYAYLYAAFEGPREAAREISRNLTEAFRSKTLSRRTFSTALSYYLEEKLGKVWQETK